MPKVIVNVADAKVSNNTSDVLATYSLGSCIGVSLYDPVVQAGGILHYQLPDSQMDQDRARQKPFMFADTGMKFLLQKLTAIGANKNRLQAKIAGGAAMNDGPKGFDIGKRNHLAIRKLLWKNGIFIKAEEIGGNEPRNLYLNIADGTVTVKSNGFKKKI